MSNRARALAYAGGFGIVLLGLAAGGCKKAAPQPPPPPPAAPIRRAPPEPELPPISCPPPEAFLAPFLAQPPLDAAPASPEDKAGVKPGEKPAPKPKPAKKVAAGKAPARALRTSCVVFAPGRFWLAAALGFDEKTGKNPRLALLSGSPASKMMVFDVVPLPTAPIEKLLSESKEIDVHIRKTRDDHSLVRLGVAGGPGGDKPDSREVGILLQLMAHKPPAILWMGEGDQVTTDAQGCVVEQAVDFELLFHTRLEQFTIGRPRPDKTGKVPATCKAGPSTQESLNYRAQALPPGHVYDPAAPAAGKPSP
jgi:hypothetical protein